MAATSKTKAAVAEQFALGDTVIHTGDGRTGTVVGIQQNTYQDDSLNTTNLLFEYEDQAGRAAQAWFPQGDCQAYTPPS